MLKMHSRLEVEQSLRSRLTPFLQNIAFPMAARAFLGDQRQASPLAHRISFFISQIVEDYNAVSEGRVNGVDSSDWIWIAECPVRPNSASALSLLNSVFLFTTATLEGPAGEDGEPARRRNCFPPQTPPSSAAVVKV